MNENKSRHPALGNCSSIHRQKGMRRWWSIAAISLCALMLAGGQKIAEAALTNYIEGEVIVTFKPAIDLPTARQAVSAHSLEFFKPFALLSEKRGRQFGLVRAKNRTTASLVAELSRDPAVEIAEPNYLRWVSARPPNDPLLPHLWALQNKGQSVNSVTGTSGDDT